MNDNDIKYILGKYKIIKYTFLKDDIKNYLLNRYNDFYSINEINKLKESYYRIINNIEQEDLQDIEILKERSNRIHKEKNVSISRYDNELETWTIRDVNKRNIAIQNNLNYIEFWNIKELENWINNGK